MLAVLAEKILNPIVGAGTKWQNARDDEKMIQGRGSIVRHIPGISGVKNNAVLAFLLHKAIH